MSFWVEWGEEEEEGGFGVGCLAGRKSAPRPLSPLTHPHTPWGQQRRRRRGFDQLQKTSGFFGTGKTLPWRLFFI